jgi:hypothetical protein
MGALIIESSNPKNLELLAELAKKMGDHAVSISASDVEDLLLGEMMNHTKSGEYVTKEEVMRKLTSK